MYRSYLVIALIASTLPLARSQQTLSSQDILAKINEAENLRERNLQRYTVQEHYEIYHPGQTPDGDATFKVTYVKGQGKDYQPVGDPIFKRFLVRHALAAIIKGQEALSKPPLRSTVIPNTENYSMTLLDEGKEPAPTYLCNFPRADRKTRVLAIRPLHPAPELIDGYLWVDAKSFHIVRIEGRLSQSPNLFIGRPLFERDYVDKNGFAVAVSSCQETDSFFSHYWSKITYENYEITTDKDPVELRVSSSPQ